MSAEREKAYTDGWAAYWKGVDQQSNPFSGNFSESPILELDLRDEWNLGWLTAQRADKGEI